MTDVEGPVDLQENDHSWTIGNDPALTHVRAIDSGASGEVHAVRPKNGFPAADILVKKHLFR